MYHNAMRALAVYEVFTPASERADLANILRRFHARKLEGGREEKDPLGNIMVESTQQLSGAKKTRKNPKARKPPSLSLSKDQQKKTKRGKHPKKDTPIEVDNMIVVTTPREMKGRGQKKHHTEEKSP